MKKNLVWLLALLVFGKIHAQIPRLTKDINTGYLSSNASNFFAHGNYLFFSATSDSESGSELWRTDGTDTGTYLVKDLCMGAGSGNPHGYCSVGSILYFVAYDGINGIELWKTDGTNAGTQLVKDICPGINNGNPLSLVNFKGKVMFTAFTVQTGTELWVSDGTDTGTYMVKEIRSGAASPTISNLIVMGDSVFFTADNGINGRELWYSNGTDIGTQLLKDINPTSGSGISNLTLFNNKLYFVADNNTSGFEIFVSDGTAAGTKIYQDFIPGTVGITPNYLTVSGPNLFFSGSSSFGNELMKLNGVDSIQVIDISPFGSSTPQNLINCAGTLFFTASVDNGRELYVSNGTKAGTRMTRDLYPIQTDGYISNLTVVDTTLYLSAHETPNYQDYEVYYCTPGFAYPRRVRDIAVGQTSSNPGNFVAFKNKLFFTANDQKVGVEIWMAIGNTANLVKDVYSATQDAQISSIKGINGKVIFNALNSIYGDEIWRSSGDTSSTQMIRDIISGSAGSSPKMVYSNAKEAYFSLSSVNNSLFYRTDGTDAGTVPIYIPAGTAELKDFVELNNELYFTRRGSSFLENIYKYTPSGGANTIRILNPNNLGDEAANLTVFKNKIYFSADNGNDAGNELFVTDGTYAGTQLVKDIYSGYQDGNPRNLTAVDSLLFFTATNGINGIELWASDGTSTNTKMVKDIFPGSGPSYISSLVNFKHKAYFSAFTSPAGSKIWSSDGTTAGTQMLSDLFPNGGLTVPSNLMVVGDLLFFVAHNPQFTEVLCVTDGTPAGTIILKEFAAGTAGPQIKNFTRVRNYLYFTAYDTINGMELWRSDGSIGGTKMLPEVFVGAGSSNPNLLTLVGDSLYYTAYHPNYGMELWCQYTNCMIGGMQAAATCVGDSVQFLDKTNSLGSTLSAFKWNFGNGDSSLLQNPLYAFDSVGTYIITLQATNTEACSVDFKQALVIKEKAQAKFLVNSDSLCFKGHSFSFTNQTIAGLGESRLWNFGDGINSTVPNPTYSYKTPGKYFVQLIVGSRPACKSTYSDSVLVFATPLAPTIMGKTTSFDSNTDSFWVSPSAGSSYLWSITGGTIIGASNLDNVFVKWILGAKAGTVQVRETSSYNCPSDPKIINITLSTNALSEMKNEFQLDVFPNPANSQITLRGNLLQSGDLKIQLMDGLGKIVLSQNLEISGTLIDKSINLQGIEAGIYVLNLTKNGQTISKKLILQK
ncbi:MAG: hypothetical protein CFE21_08245 [Bacteroidetes bacterium B1(2017)]|nr:MAG: hypothetical protein CFE21_08245 [Bacteroidetes bacterium B1(2017)]